MPVAEKGVIPSGARDLCSRGSGQQFVHCSRRNHPNDRTPALPHQGSRPHRASCRPDGGAAACRLGRRRDQDRTAAGARQQYRCDGRQPPRLRLPEPASQQAIADPQPEEPRRPRDLHEARQGCRRGRRELSFRREVPAEGRLRDGGQGQSAHRLRLDRGLWPERPRRGASRRRPDRAGHGRADVDHRRAGPRARCGSASRSPTSPRACCSPRR